MKKQLLCAMLLVLFFDAWAMKGLAKGANETCNAIANIMYPLDLSTTNYGCKYQDKVPGSMIFCQSEKHDGKQETVSKVNVIRGVKQVSYALYQLQLGQNTAVDVGDNFFVNNAIMGLSKDNKICLQSFKGEDSKPVSWHLSGDLIDSAHNGIIDAELRSSGLQLSQNNEEEAGDNAVGVLQLNRLGQFELAIKDEKGNSVQVIQVSEKAGLCLYRKIGKSQVKSVQLIAKESSYFPSKKKNVMVLNIEKEEKLNINMPGRSEYLGQLRRFIMMLTGASLTAICMAIHSYISK